MTQQQTKIKSVWECSNNAKNTSLLMCQVYAYALALMTAVPVGVPLQVGEIGELLEPTLAQVNNVIELPVTNTNSQVSKHV